MVILKNNLNQIENFIQNSIQKFQLENGKPSSIGIYCCPWAGWLTINYNISKSIDETYMNCPDFEVVEFSYVEFPEWQEEYENDLPKFELGEKIFECNQDFGDEELNQLFFNYLKPIVSKIKENINSEFLLQMLDSSFSEKI